MSSPLWLPVASLLAGLAIGAWRRPKCEQKEAAWGAAKRRARVASVRRAAGHTWLLTAFLASTVIAGLLFGVGRPAPSARVALGVSLFAVIAGIAIPKMVLAYRDAKRIREGNSH